MKICFVASTYPRSDSDTAVPWLREDLRRLKDRGHDVHVFAPAFKGSRSHMVDGIPVHRFRYFLASKEDLTHDAGAPTKIRRLDYLLISLVYVIAGAVQFAFRHWRERFDIVHVHWPFPHGFFGTLAVKVRPAPLVLSFHGAELLLAKKFKFVDPILKVLTRNAQAVTCNSSYTAEAIRKLGTCDPIILPYGCPIPRRDATTPDNAVKTILFVGRLIERKGVEYLLKAFVDIRNKIPSRLVIVGNGVLLPNLRQQAAELGISSDVEFRVDIPEAELISAYEESDVFVLPAIVDSCGDTEGLGVVLIEALSFRRPVIASNVGGIPDVIMHEKTGLLVAEKDPAALSESICRVLIDQEYGRSLAEAGYNHVQVEFDWDQIISRTIELYSGLDSVRVPATMQEPVQSEA